MSSKRVLVAVFAIAGLSRQAVAQTPAAPSDAGVTDLVTQCLKAVQDGNWWLAAGVVLMLVVYGLRYVATAKPSKWTTWVTTDAGGFWLTAALSALGGVVHALAAGQPLDEKLLITALKVLGTASLTYMTTRKGFSIKLPMAQSAPAPVAPAPSPTPSAPQA